MLVSDITGYKPTVVQSSPVYFFDDVTLASEAGGDLVFDIESFPNFFLIAFKSFKTGLTITFASTPDNVLEGIQLGKLRWICDNFTLVGFNSSHYDIHMLFGALSGMSYERLHDVNNAIIIGDMRPRELRDHYGFESIPLDHIDLSEVAVGRWTSLKAYGARMHVPRIQDLEFDPQQPLTRDEAAEVWLYCINDLDLTAYLYAELQPQIDLRKGLMKDYHVDLRSKSDSQIAEAVIGSEIKKLTKSYPRKPKITKGTAYQYKVPDWLVFRSDKLNQFVETIAKTNFVVNDKGSIELPEHLRVKFPIGNSHYQFGVGGLHSTEGSTRYISDKDYVLLDRDVASYYPAIILTQRLFPDHLGENFLDVYTDIVSRRLRAKKEGRKTASDGLKITINGSFGKFASKYSVLYSPNLLMQVTITGQLALLMLIEAIENIDKDVSVVSANTDGIVTRCRRDLYEKYLGTVYEWEERSGFDTEETEYYSLHSRDVNNYIAVKPDGKFKAKGAYSVVAGSPPSRLGKNPVGEICVDAIVNLLTKNIPIEKTIFKCKDIEKFLFVRKVKGGAVKDEHFLGKTIRWYYRKNEFGCIKYANNGNKVPKTDGAWPLLKIESFPTDVDYQWYFRETMSMLKDIGFYGIKETQLELF